MKRVLATLRQTLAVRFLVLVLMGVFAWAGFLTIAPQPGYAANSTNLKSAQENVISPDSQSYSSREEAYDKALQAVNDPNGMEKEYEKDIEIFKKENPDKTSLVEEAKDVASDVVNKVKGND